MELPNQQYVTIKEFATLANVTTQAVYKRLNQTDSALNQYVQYSGKLKLINKDALELFSDNLQSQRDEYDGQDVSAYNDINVQYLYDQGSSVMYLNHQSFLTRKTSLQKNCAYGCRGIFRRSGGTDCAVYQ